jgi:hypothetical protein
MSRFSIVVVGLLVACSPSGREPREGDRDSGPGILPGTDGGMPIPRGDAGPMLPPAPGDRDGDGLPDEDEVTRGTNPDVADTDGDGYTDGVEVVAMTNPADGSSFIPPTDFYVVLPFEDPAQMRELDFVARLGKGDVLFLVDTTGSMGTSIMNVRTSLSTMIVPAVRDAIADVVMGVGDFRDFPTSPYGDAGDWPFLVRQTMTADVGAVQTALNTLAAGGGNDGPESMAEGLYQSVTSGACPDGFGQVCFRSESHPIIVVVTDAPSHNGPGGENAYAAPVRGASWMDAVNALNAGNVKVVGVGVTIAFPFPLPIPIPGGAASRPHLEALATATSSRGFDGALTVFDAEGGMVSNAVVDGIVDLVGATTQDVTTRSIDDASDAVDATQFIKAVTPARATRAVDFDETTFFGVAGGTVVTFSVTFENDFLPETDRVQIFRAQIEVHDLPGRTPLDTRNVYIVVPRTDGGLI